MRRFGDAIRHALADSKISRVHELLRGVENLTQLVEGQCAADMLGCAATNCSQAGLHLESRSLRRISQIALEEVVQEELLGCEEHSMALEQIVLRALEPHCNDLDRALRYATQGAAHAQRESMAWNLKRFQAIHVHIQTRLSAQRHFVHTMPKQLFNGVDRRADLSLKDFARLYSKKRRPVIIVGQIGFPPLWDLSELASQSGNSVVLEQRYDASSDMWASIVPHKMTTLNELITCWASGSRDGFVFDQPLSACPNLLSMLKWPSWVEDADLIRRALGAGQQEHDPFWDHPSLFVQPKNSQCGVHVDAAHSQFIQGVLSGRKRWIFYPFDDVDQVRWMGRRDDVSLEVHVDTDHGGHFRRQIKYEQVFPVVDFAMHSKSTDAAIELMKIEVEVNAGEMIIVPGGVPHQVINLEDTIAVSRNFIDADHAARAAVKLRWPIPFHSLADFLEEVGVCDDEGVNDRMGP